MKKLPKKKIPKFSIITVVKNDEKGIKKTIDSISKQSFKILNIWLLMENLLTTQ